MDPAVPSVLKVKRMANSCGNPPIGDDKDSPGELFFSMDIYPWEEDMSIFDIDESNVSDCCTLWLCQNSY